jgi:hypothetical protein
MSDSKVTDAEIQEAIKDLGGHFELSVRPVLERILAERDACIADGYDPTGCDKASHDSVYPPK